MSGNSTEFPRFVRRKINNCSIVCLRDAQRALGITVETLHKYVRNGLSKQETPEDGKSKLTYIDLREAWEFHKEWVLRVKEERRLRAINMVENHGQKRIDNYHKARLEKALDKEIEEHAVLLSKYCLGEVDDNFVERIMRLDELAVEIVRQEYDDLHEFHKLAWSCLKQLIAFKEGRLIIEDCPETDDAIREAEEEENKKFQMELEIDDADF